MIGLDTAAAVSLPFSFSDSIAIVVIAGLLSLLPVMVLLWIYYVRERQPAVRGPVMTQFFAVGMVTVVLAILLESSVHALWNRLSPSTVSAFFIEGVSAESVAELLTAIAVSFGIIALIEEGTRYILMRTLFERTTEFNQIIDGVQLGFAAGLGFAFLENTIYFLQLFRGLEFDRLVVVFFLRFLISTVGHLAFGGIMGYYLALAAVYPTERREMLQKAFFFPWIMHGLFNTLLAVQLAFFIVPLLIIPLSLFWVWFRDERLFELYVLHGKRLRFPVAAHPQQPRTPRPAVVEVLPAMTTCPICYVPLGARDMRCRSCGVRFHRRPVPSILPFLGRSS